MHAKEKTGPAHGSVTARHSGHRPLATASRSWRPEADGRPVATCVVPAAAITCPWQPDDDDEIPDDGLEPELLDPGDLEIDDVPGGDDAYWDVFIPDDDECDPLPEPGDFWIDEGQGPRVEGQGPE